MITIAPVDSTEDFHRFTALVEELTVWDRQETERLGFDFGYVENLHAYESQPDTIPAEYLLPDGCLLLARDDAAVCGCAAIKRLSVTICELKRLYVDPDCRGRGAGRALAAAAMQQARAMGYTVMRLETASFMSDAHALYRSLGFHDIEPFRELPDDLRQISIFMEFDLSR